MPAITLSIRLTEIFFTRHCRIEIARVPEASGFFAQGDCFEEARENLRNAIEGTVTLALQLGFEISHLPGIEIEERTYFP